MPQVTAGSQRSLVLWAPGTQFGKLRTKGRSLKRENNVMEEEQKKILCTVIHKRAAKWGLGGKPFHT